MRVVRFIVIAIYMMALMVYLFFSLAWMYVFNRKRYYQEMNTLNKIL